METLFTPGLTLEERNLIDFKKLQDSAPEFYHFFPTHDKWGTFKALFNVDLEYTRTIITVYFPDKTHNCFSGHIQINDFFFDFRNENEGFELTFDEMIKEVFSYYTMWGKALIYDQIRTKNMTKGASKAWDNWLKFYRQYKHQIFN